MDTVDQGVKITTRKIRPANAAFEKNVPTKYNSIYPVVKPHMAWGMTR